MSDAPSLPLPPVATGVGYRTGVAARLAGLPVETLRVWERRYGVVGPPTSDRGHRLYSADDVARLALLRQLVELGTPIGSVARLELPALRAMLADGRRAAQGSSARSSASSAPLTVAVVGTALAAQVARDCAFIDTLEMVASSAAPSHAVAAFAGVRADVLAIEMPVLHSGALAQVDALVDLVGARHAIVAYRFAPKGVVDALHDAGHIAVHAPLGGLQLERLCSAQSTRSVDDPVSRAEAEPPARRFDEQALSEIARALTTLHCECPRHLVELLIGLGTFEQYSADCASRSPADARLHRYLQRVAGATRVMFEDALERVAQAEGVALATGRESA
jgi:hypothetical protein